jgi:hypothetical protein
VCGEEGSGSEPDVVESLGRNGDEPAEERVDSDQDRGQQIDGCRRQRRDDDDGDADDGEDAAAAGHGRFIVRPSFILTILTDSTVPLSLDPLRSVVVTVQPVPLPDSRDQTMADLPLILGVARQVQDEKPLFVNNPPDQKRQHAHERGEPPIRAERDWCAEEV